MKHRLKYWLEAFYPIWLGIIFALIVLPLANYELEAKSFLFACLYEAFGTLPLWGTAVLLLSNYVKHDSKIEHIDLKNQLLHSAGKSYKIQQVSLIRRNPRMDLGFDFLPWSKFKYLMLNCEDGSKFYVSCLSNYFDQLNPTRVLNKNYPRIPYLQNESENVKIESEIEFWKTKYAGKSHEELNKINASSGYTKSAKRAAKQLLKENTEDGSRRSTT